MATSLYDGAKARFHFSTGQKSVARFGRDEEDSSPRVVLPTRDIRCYPQPHCCIIWAWIRQGAQSFAITSIALLSLGELRC